MSEVTRRLVLGTWGLAGSSVERGRPLGYGAVSEEEAHAILDVAWATGIRWADTAPSYGGGRGLRRLSTWQHSRGLRYACGLKCGRPIRQGVPFSDLSPHSMIAEVKASAIEVGSPRVVFVKDPPMEALEDGTVSALREILAARWPEARTGLATHLCELPERLLQDPPGVLQIEYSGVNWRRAAPVVARFAQAGWEVWAMQTLAYGWLARSEGEHREFGEDDFRATLSAHSCALLHLISSSFFQAMMPWTQAYPRSVVALAFVLSNPAVARVVIGPRHRRHLEDIAPVARLIEDAAFGRHVHALLNEAL